MTELAKLRKKEIEEFNREAQGTEQNQSDLITEKFLDHSMVSDDTTGTFAEDNLNKSLEKLVVLKSERTYKERLKNSPLGLIEG